MELEADKQSLCSLTVAAHPNGEAFHQAAVLATVPKNIRCHSFSQGSKFCNMLMSGSQNTPNPVQFVPNTIGQDQYVLMSLVPYCVNTNC